MKSTQHPANGTRGIKRIDLAYVELASSENARDINRDIVLEIIRSQQPVARADLELRSSPANKLLVLERLILDLSTEPKPTPYEPSHQFAMEL